MIPVPGRRLVSLFHLIPEVLVRCLAYKVLLIAEVVL